MVLDAAESTIATTYLLMVRSSASRCVTNHAATYAGASSFETRHKSGAPQDEE